MIALLTERGVAVANDATDQWLKEQVRGLSAPQNVENAGVRRDRISREVQGLVDNFQMTILEAPAAITRAIADESYLSELRNRPQNLPGNAPLNGGLSVLAQDARDSLAAIQKHVVEGPKCAAMTRDEHVRRGAEMTRIWTKERARILPVLNAAATNTVDSGLKRVAILNETVRDFATVVLPLRLLSTVFQNVPLQGTDEIEVPYYPLQTAASSDFTDGDGTGGTGYQFGQGTNTSAIKITVNKRKYQPMDYSSSEFRRQPWFESVRLGKMNAEKLGADIITDILSVITAANYGAAAVTSAAASLGSDDIINVRTACNNAMWPKGGRSLIVNTDADGSLQKDPAYKIAMNIGTSDVIQLGKFPKLSGFDYSELPNLPTNGEKLIGFAAFVSAILAAFCPVDPAPGVRAQLVAYEVVTEPTSGVSLNYRHWGNAQADRDYEIIESAYGYKKGIGAALKRICSP